MEATTKSSEHFPDEPGGRAYFSFTAEGGGAYRDTATAFPTASYDRCHQSNGADDFVFSQYYPVIRAAMGEAPGTPEQANNTDARAVPGAGVPGCVGCHSPGQDSVLTGWPIH